MMVDYKGYLKMWRINSSEVLVSAYNQLKLLYDPSAHTNMIKAKGTYENADDGYEKRSARESLDQAKIAFNNKPTIKSSLQQIKDIYQKEVGESLSESSSDDDEDESRTTPGSGKT